MFKKTIYLISLFFCLFNIQAQKGSNIKLTLEGGFLAFSKSENLGFFLNVEPKLKVSENTFIGLRIGATINSQVYENKDSTLFKIGHEYDNGFASVVPTFEYHWDKDNFRPYLGIGIGPYLLANYVDVSRAVIINPSEDEFEIKIKYRLGILLRGGVERGKSRLGMEYNLIPKTDIKIPDGQKVGIVKSSYFGFAYGYTIGG